MAEGQHNNKGKGQYFARLENQKAQLERHGNFAEVVIRTTPEGTDMLNFARLWEHVLVMGDRSTRGYMAKKSREDFDQTRQDFDECIALMIEKLKESIDRHDIDLAGSNFISRVAQRYKITEKRKPTKKELETEKARKEEAKAAKAAKAETAESPAEEKAAAPKAAAKKAPAKEKAEDAPKKEAKGSVLEESVEGF
jgi:exonuclease VII large subunit